ncbi:hypothetical protein SAY86_030867 [Trapa natans]|uniref:MSP domain-containing protein n=1 Tax=Trapa natans TaxID=22666 RepID=A0AAN7RHI0_TRANT|nr:hypothetical protein SAY86_030867 [Trapa natans]
MEGDKSKKKLVEVTPGSEVVIDFVLSRKCRANVQLRSLCPASTVAFKVQTSSPDRFLVNPPIGTISPLSAITFQIILKPQHQLPPTYPRSLSDRFLVRTAALDQSDSTAPESINSWLSSRPPGTTQDIKLKVAFVGPSLLHHAVSCGDFDAVRKLVKRRNTILAGLSHEKADSLIQIVASSEHPFDMAKLLVELGLGFCQAGMNVGEDGGDAAGRSIDDAACVDNLRRTEAEESERGEAILTAARRGDLKQLESLIDGVGGTIPTFSDQYGLTGLHAASIKGHTEVVELLIRRGMDLECQDKEGHRPLHLAVEGGSVSTVQALIDLGADVNAATRSGATPLYTAKAMGYEDIARLLEESMAERECQYSYK